MHIKLLLLEDHRDDVELMLLELNKSSLDFEYLHADDKETYRAALRNYQPDLILSDYNIPGYDGLEALADARELDPQIPFIMISGTVDTDESIRYIVDHGVSDIILKDKMQRLSLTISREMDKLEIQQQLNRTQQSLVERTRELELLSKVASKTHIGVIITDAEGITEWVNEGFTELTGYTLEDIAGMKPGDLLQGEDSDPGTIKEITQNLNAHISFKSELINYHKNGAPYWVKLTIDPVFDDQGTLTSYIAIQEDITKNKEMELQLLQSNQDLKDALQEKQILIQEVHHRVKNNLAIINALLTLELFEMEPEDENRMVLERTINRIISIKEAHELLYDNTNFTHINLKDYVNSLLNEIQSTFSSHKSITIDLNVPRIDLDINTLIPLGMLLNELFTNSYKYAFANRDEGNICLHVQNVDGSDSYTMLYKDDGPGLQKKIDLQNPPSLGFEIIHTLLNQLKADYSYDFEHTFYLDFSFQIRTKGSHSADLSLYKAP